MSVTVPQYVTDIEIGTPGSLTALMDALTGMQDLMPDLPALSSLQRLRPYRWRPATVDAPCLYNMLLPSTREPMDLNRFRDNIVIATRIGQSYSDADQNMTAIELYADAYRALADANFWDGSRPPRPIALASTWSMRNTMQSFSDAFGEMTLTGIEFTQTFSLDRHPR